MTKPETGGVLFMWLSMFTAPEVWQPVLVGVLVGAALGGLTLGTLVVARRNARRRGPRRPSAASSRLRAEMLSVVFGAGCGGVAGFLVVFAVLCLMAMRDAP